MRRCERGMSQEELKNNKIEERERKRRRELWRWIQQKVASRKQKGGSERDEKNTKRKGKTKWENKGMLVEGRKDSLQSICVDEEEKEVEGKKNR